MVAYNDTSHSDVRQRSGNLFTENNFSSATSPLTIVGKTTGSFWNHERRGNYWSSYDGYDLDNDGVGDVPMKIQNVFNFLEGRQPNLRLYLYSPASQALASATTAFPIMDINHEIDAYPLRTPVDLRELTLPQTSPSEYASLPAVQKAGLIGALFVGACAFSIAFLNKRGRGRL
jgi:nitrous oxidase accessory protein